jgi:2-phosphosulfolactate phosphatase
MKIDLFFTPGELPPSYSKGRRLVLVDVLRACTSLAVALSTGAERIVPAESVEGAKRLLALLDRESTLLAGEQDGVKLPGFDLGNSPGEFRDHRVAGMTLVFTSTNAAPLMARMVDEVEKPLLAFVNMQAVVDFLRAIKDPELSVVCAGHSGHFSLEDAVCGGMLCARLQEHGAYELNDGAKAALLLYQHHRGDLPGLLRACAHGRFLCELGMEADLREAAAVDSISLVPVVRESRVTEMRPPWNALSE